MRAKVAPCKQSQRGVRGIRDVKESRWSPSAAQRLLFTHSDWLRPPLLVCPPTSLPADKQQGNISFSMAARGCAWCCCWRYRAGRRHFGLFFLRIVHDALFVCPILSSPSSCSQRASFYGGCAPSLLLALGPLLLTPYWTDALQSLTPGPRVSRQNSKDMFTAFRSHAA